MEVVDTVPMLRQLAFVFCRYLLVGVGLNWASVFGTWGVLNLLTWKDTEMYRELHDKYWSMRVGLPVKVSRTASMLLTLLFWPLCVFNNAWFGGRAVAEALRRKAKRRGL